MSFSPKNLNQFINKEIDTLNQLRKISVFNFRSFDLDFSILRNYKANTVMKEYHDIKYYIDLKKIKNPVIYFFKIESDHKGEKIVASLKKIKTPVHQGRHCPKIVQKESYESRILYVGSVRKNISSRLLQHLGYGSEKTYALQLIHWAKRLNLKLSFNYIEIDNKCPKSLEYLEEAIWNYYKPLVGKKPR